MTITGKAKAFYYNKVKPTYEHIVSGDCVKNFKGYKPNRRSDIIMKVALIAAAVGIITGALFALANPVVGAVIGVTWALSAGIWAFGYYTMDDTTLRNCKDSAIDNATNVKDKIKKFPNKLFNYF